MKKESGNTKAQPAQGHVQSNVMDGSEQANDVFDLAPLPYQSLDGEGRILTVNAAWLEMLGYEKAKVIGTWIGDYLTPASVELLKDRFSAFQAEGEVRNAEFTMIRRDGSRTLVTVNGRIAYDEEGNFKQTHCILNDITEKRRAEQDIASSEQRFRGLFESSIDGIVYTDIMGTMLDINPAFCSMLGMDSQELLGKNVQDITPKHFIEFEKGLFRSQVLVNGFCEEFHKEYYHAKGHRVPASVRIWLNRDAEGKPVGAWGVVRDVSETIQAELALKQSENQYRRIIETANEGIIGLDADLRIVFSNQVTTEFLGYEQQEFLGRHILDLFPLDEKPDMERRFAERKLGIKDRYECSFLHRDGSVVWGLVSATPLLSESGEYTGSFAMIADITDRKRAEAELQDSEQKYRTIFEKSIEGLYQSVPGGGFISANPAMARIMGYDSPDELIATVTDIAAQLYVDPNEREKVVGIIMKDGGIKDYELRYKRKDGSVIWAALNARAVFDDDGQFSMLEGSVVDISERKLADEALRLTQFSVDNAPIDIYWINREGRFVYVNDRACMSVGYTRDEMLQMTVSDINPDIEAEAWPSRWEQRRGQGIVRFETAHQRKDGSNFPVGITSYFVKYGGQEYLFSYAYDLTEREQAEENLRRSQDLLNEVQRISLTGGWDVDMASGEVFWTEGQCRLHGVGPGEAPKDMQEFMEMFVHPNDRAKAAHGWNSIISELVPAEVEYRTTKADGTEAIFVSMGIPDVGEDGVLKRIYGSNRDVTMERQAARDLEQSHQRMLTILDGIDADVYVSDLEGNEVLFMNAHMQEHFGMPTDSMPCFELFRGEVEQCSFCPKPELLDENGTPVGTVISERHNPLTNRWYLNHDRAIEWLEGKLVHMHMAADITALKSMEDELKDAMSDAEAANVAKNEFLANMSHEIRTPLNGLLGMLQILQLTSLVEEQRDYLNTAVDSGRNLLQILNDILDLSKIESGMLEFDEQEMELGEVLDSVISVFRHLAQTRGVEMFWKIDESLTQNFLADKGRLRQILFNLVGNAAKFTESGSVTVEAYPLSRTLPDGRMVLYFSVKDTGIGIPDSELDKIFDPFTQVDGSSSRKYQGTGLGLGIVRRLVKLMGGHVSVSSEEGKGTTIVFTIAVQPSSLSPKEAAPAGLEEADNRLSILVAEDEHVNRIVVQRLLSKLGHDVMCVEDGQKAIEVLETQVFDCFLTDIQMPGLDGVETTRVIREKLKLDIPVIALTAHAMKGDRNRFLDAGMDGYIAKPFEMAELQEELVRVMATYRT